MAQRLHDPTGEHSMNPTQATGRRMMAIVFDTPGEAEHVLTVREIDVPQPAHGEVLVRVAARPIQPSDLMFIAGRYRIRPVLPQVAGLESAGTVVAAGAGVSLAIGTRVAFRHPASWAEYVCVPASVATPVPDGIADEDAAQYSLNPVTAWGLLDEARVAGGDWIVVNAATSLVARLAIGLATRRGVHAVAIVRGGPAPTLPAAVVVDAADLSERVLAATGGAAVSALLDAIGGTAVTRMLPALKPGATIVSYGLLGSEPAQISNADLIYRNLRWQGFGVDLWLAHAGAQERARMTHALWRAMAGHAITLPVKARYALDRAALAIAELRTGSGFGKVLLSTPLAQP